VRYNGISAAAVCQHVVLDIAHNGMTQPSNQPNPSLTQAVCLRENFAVLYAMVWPPYYDGPRSYGKPLVPDHFHRQVMPSSGPSSGYWLVMFTVYSAFESIAVLPLFDALATEFSGGPGRLNFGEVDVGSWQELAQHFKVPPASFTLSAIAC